MPSPTAPVLLTGLLVAALMVPAGAVTVRVCIPSNPFPPLTFPDHEGQGQWLARRAVESQGASIAIEPVPWPRCLKGLSAGDYDAAMPPTQALAASLALPLREDGSVDEGKALGDVSMMVLRRVGSAAHWDGRRFSGVVGPVLFNRGIVSVRDKLATLGVVGDEGAQPNESLLQKLQRGRGDLLILNRQAAEQALADSEAGAGLEMLPEPFIALSGHLGFSKAFHDSHRSLVEAVWNQIAKLKASAAYRQLAPSLGR